jgi:integrase
LQPISGRVFRVDRRRGPQWYAKYKAAVKRASVRPLRFDDLRHTFGTLAVRRAEVPAVQAWRGHSSMQTTVRYSHHHDRGDEARLLAEAFRVEQPAPEASRAET